MLPERRWTHVRAIRQIIHLQRLREMLLEPGDHLRNLLVWGSGDDEVAQVRAVRTCQQADGDFLLYQRRKPRNEDWLVEEIDEPHEGIEQDGVQCFERDRSMGVISRNRGASISEAVCKMERTSSVSIMPRKGSRALARVTWEMTGRSIVVTMDCPGP
jgi:hypothetical protein